MRPRLLPCVLGALLGALPAAPAAALEIGRHRLDPGGRVKAVRALDLDRDGRQDLVLLLEAREGRGGSLLLLRAPAAADARTFFPAAGGVRLALDGDLAQAGAVALGRFGPEGEPRLRFLTAQGAVDVAPDGARAATPPRLQRPTLLARSPDRPIVFWDAVADLDGDGRDECWVPVPDGGGALRVLGGTPAMDRRLDLATGSAASSTPEFGLRRTAYVPTLAPADLDGDGRRELVALSGTALAAWSVAPDAAAGDAPAAPVLRLELPFLAPPRDLGPEEVRTPRLQLADADGDGRADLLLTLVTGRRDQLGGLRTTLFYFPSPLADPATGALRAPQGRVDTESLALHPRFVDLDGDGALDYVTDSIRGSKGDLLQRVMGKDPSITLVGFRFDKAARRYESAPLFSLERPYAASQALSNQFGPSAWFDEDLDGDGLHDLLDLGNLTGVEVLGARRRAEGAVGDPLQFPAPVVPRIPVPKGLSAGALLADLTGDGRADVVLWNDDEVFVLTTKGGR